MPVDATALDPPDERVITIVVATNRPGSRSQIVADAYRDAFDALGVPSRVLNLAVFSPAMIDAVMYARTDDKAGFETLQAIVDETEKFVFVIPEYNGSFPGILKLFVDCCRYPDSFQDKKTAVVGLSSGTQGSALAMGHFADVLNYLGAHTLALRPRFIRIHNAVRDGRLVDPEYLQFVGMQARKLAEF